MAAEAEEGEELKQGFTRLLLRAPAVPVPPEEEERYRFMLLPLGCRNALVVRP